MGESQISDATLLINNDVVAYVPNSLSWDEGLGEQKVLAQSEGAGRTSQVYSADLESNIGMVKFALRGTIKNMRRAREWKQNANQNVVTIVMQDRNGEDEIRSFTGMALTTNYEIPIQAEGTIDLELHGNSPI